VKKIFIHFFKLKIVLLNINVNHIMECFIYIVIHFYTKSIKFQFYSNNFCRDTPDTFLNLREKINRYNSHVLSQKNLAKRILCSLNNERLENKRQQKDTV